MRRTKIIATVGPACDNDGAIDALMSAGVDIFRLNYSHGSHASQALTFHRIRNAAARAGRPAAILQDLGGPKIRTGTLEGGTPIFLKAGDACDRDRHRTGRLAAVDGLRRPGAQRQAGRPAAAR
jgi:pyruvate kinase